MALPEERLSFPVLTQGLEVEDFEAVAAWKTWSDAAAAAVAVAEKKTVEGWSLKVMEGHYLLCM